MGETARDIRLIAFDLDGTLLTEEKRLTARTRDILEEASARGILLLTTTGRALRGIPDAVKTLSGAKYALTANGAGVYRRIDARIDAREPDRQDDPSTRASGTTARTVWTEPLPHPAQEGYPTFELDTDHTYELLFERLMNRERTLALMAELATLEVMPDPFINGACYILADKIHLIDRMAVSDAMKEYMDINKIG